MREGFRHRPPTPQEEEDASATRRGVIMGAAALGATTIGAFKALPANPNVERHALPGTLDIRYIDTEESPLSEVVQEPVAVQEHVQASERAHNPTVPESLQTQKLSRLERAYFGLSIESPKLPATLKGVSFQNNLRAMLADKKDIVADTKTANEQQKVYDWLARSYEYLSERDGIRRTTLVGFRNLIEKESRGMLKELDSSYDNIARYYFSDTARKRHKKEADAVKEQATLAKTLKYFANHITPNIQLAYIATEIMPSTKRGAALMSVLLENAGLEFLERIPALGDKELSYGPFQLTPHVVGADGSATRMQKMMKRKDLFPNSLTEFTSIEHHLRAGQLFAVHNIAAIMLDLVRANNIDGLNMFIDSVSEDEAKRGSTVFLEYLAAAHHRPVVARTAVRNWIKRNEKRSDDKRLKIPRETTLSSSFPGDSAGEQVRVYADKAREHFHQVKKELLSRKT